MWVQKCIFSYRPRLRKKDPVQTKFCRFAQEIVIILTNDQIFLSARRMLPDYATCAVRKLGNLNVRQYKFPTQTDAPPAIFTGGWARYIHNTSIKAPSRNNICILHA